MKKSIARLWIQGLTGGEYKQCIGALHKGDCFCVFGVLCDIYAKQNNVRWELGANPTEFTMHGRVGIIPTQVIKWAGLKTDDGTYSGASANGRTLIRDNDQGVGFPVLATTISGKIKQL